MLKQGTENYTFKTIDGEMKTVKNIPSAEIDKLRKSLNLASRKEALEVWLYDNGHIGNEYAESLTQKAKDNNTNARNKGTRKAPTRQPDLVKRALISLLLDTLAAQDNIDTCAIENQERLITFSIGEDSYKLTLSKDRKKKE